MKRIFATICGAIACCSLFAQYNTQGGGSQAANPTVMVMPDLGSTMTPEKLEAAAQDNEVVVMCLAKIKEIFTSHDYPIKDYVATLRQLRTEGMLSREQGASSDLAKMLVENSSTDVVVYFKPMVQRHSDGSLEVSVAIDAQETKVAQTFATKSYSSGKFNTTDSVRLATRVVGMISNNFFDEFANGFANMVSEGRLLRVKIDFAQGCDIDAYTEVGTNGNDLETELRDWIEQNAFNSNGDLKSSEQYINMEFRVPVYDQSTGRPFQIGRMRSILLKSLNAMLQPVGVKAKTVKSDGQIVNFVITNE
ncbi:MAG: hypothetical protein KBT20_05190 [Bacteroidales bacterium]|nr:hypothetical protein [Candidatus Liminaster caballi]